MVWDDTLGIVLLGLQIVRRYMPPVCVCVCVWNCQLHMITIVDMLSVSNSRKQRQTLTYKANEPTMSS